MISLTPKNKLVDDEERMSEISVEDGKICTMSVYCTRTVYCRQNAPTIVARQHAMMFSIWVVLVQMLMLLTTITTIRISMLAHNINQE